jgi:hypothetical protein
MDSDWVFNFDCNDKATNVDSFFDANIIPSLFYQAVVNRNKNELINVIKYNPLLTKEVIKFFQYNLASSFYFKKSGKFGAPVRIKWKLVDYKEIIMNFNDQVEFYEYVVARPTNSTNFGYLMSIIKNYLSDLSYGLYLIQNKNCGAKYYYKLGVNINNDIEFRRFIAQFINS